jgi:hypothetical protein
MYNHKDVEPVVNYFKDVYRLTNKYLLDPFGNRIKLEKIKDIFDILDFRYRKITEEND